MRRFIVCLLACAMALGIAPDGHAQRLAARANIAPERVTILTDGIVDPASPSVQMVNDMAGQLSRSGMRVLPIAGEGALSNLRDLLLLKGVDLAILNSDILAYLDLTGEYPDARRKIRYVTHLYDQTVYLLARKEFASLDALRGRKVAAGLGAITARTIFALQKSEVSLQPLGSEQFSNSRGLDGIDGLVMLSSEISRLGITASALGDFHVIPIAPTPALAKVYRPVRIVPEELAGVARTAAPLESVAISTVLAVFDWTPQQTRYVNVTTFIKGLFANLPALRDAAGGAPWKQADIKMAVPGWTRHAAADPDKLLTRAQLATLAEVGKPVRPAPAPSLPAVAPSTAPPLSMLVVNRAPLADERAPDGGLVPALLVNGLGLAGPGKGQRPSIKWSKSDAVSLQLLTNETAADVLLPWDLADCDRPNGLTQSQAMLCDRAHFSDPIMQVVMGLFTLAGSDFKFETDAGIQGRTLCVPLDRDLAELTAPGRNWIAEKRIVLIRQPTLLDCAGSVQRREADAFVATDIEGWHLLKQFGIAPLFAMTERPVGTRTIHAAVWKSNPRSAEILATINDAIRQSKDSGSHATLVRQHLMSIWDNKINVQ